MGGGMPGMGGQRQQQVSAYCNSFPLDTAMSRRLQAPDLYASPDAKDVVKLTAANFKSTVGREARGNKVRRC